MGTLKINWWIASITAILLLFGAFVVVKAVESDITTQKANSNIVKAHVPTWHFTGTDPSQILTLGNWEEGPAPSSANCVNDPDAPLPCQYTVSDENEMITNEQELLSYFSNTYPSNTQTAVRDNADSQKDE